MKYLVVTTVLAVSFLLSSANADRAHRRERRQDARIGEGVASGQLTKKETRRLKLQQKHIDRAQNKAAADGVVTLGEKAKLEKMQDRASKNIYIQKHDGQKVEEPAPEKAPGQ